MYNFAIRRAYNSDKLLVEFVSDPSDQDFQAALQEALVPLGFSVTRNEHGVWATHPEARSEWAAVAINSDAWCTFGEADLWSGSLVQNHELTRRLGTHLVATGNFHQVQWHGERQPGA